MITLPDTEIRILAALEDLDYFDSQVVSVSRDILPLDAWNLVMEDPQPLLRLAFRVRDGISKLFGVKSIGGFSNARKDSVHCLLYTSPSPRDLSTSRMPSSA